MYTEKNIKGFSIRRRGRPAGSRAVDRDQRDFFQTEKIVYQILFQKKST